MLTPNIDVATAHTFNANPVMSSTGDTRWDTLNSGDKLTGDGAGSVLNIITVDDARGAGGQSATNNILPTITNVETLNANVYHGLEINSQYVTGMKNVNLLEATHNFSMKGTDSKLENVTVSNLENNVTKINATFQVNSTYLTGDADALNLAISNVVVGSEGVSKIDVRPTNTADVYETLNLASNGSVANAFTLASTANTINVSGAANAEIGVQETNGTLKTLDASAAAGNVAVYGLDAIIENAKFGAGDNIVSFTGVNNGKFTTKVDGGAGNDLFAINGYGIAKGKTEELNNATNFETIRLSNADSSIDIDKLTNGVKNFEVANGNFVFEKATADNGFTVINNSWLGITNANADGLATGENGGVIYGSTTAGLTITGTDGGATAVTLTNGTGTGTLTSLKTNANDISIVSTGNHANTIGGIDAGYRGEGNIGAEKFISIKVSGDQNLTATLNATSGDYLHNGYKVDASALQGSLFLTGADNESDIVVGTANNDIINTGVQIHGVPATEGTPASVKFGTAHAALSGDASQADEATAFTKFLTKVTTDLSVTVNSAAGTNKTFTVSAADVKAYFTGIFGNPLQKAEVFTVAGTSGNADWQVSIAANKLTGKYLKPLLEKAFIPPTSATGTNELLTNSYNIDVDATGAITLTQKAGTEENLTSVIVTGIATGATFFTATNWDSSNSTFLGVADLTNTVPSKDKIVGTYDKFTGGDGADKFIFGDFRTSDPLDQAFSNSETPTSEITDFESGVDSIKFNSGIAGSEANFKTGKLYGSLQELYKAAKEEFSTNAATTYFVGQVGNDTYLFNDANVPNNTAGAWYDAIKLTGVDLTGIAASDIVATA